MRVHLHLSPNTVTIPFDHLPALTGAVHKWIGQNDVHNSTSLYSFSWLQGGRRVGDGLGFERGASFFFSAYDRGLVQRLVSGVLQDAVFAHGMRVTDIQLQETPAFGERQVFRVGGPVLARKPSEEAKHDEHLLYTNPESNAVLTRTLQHKLGLAGLDTDGAQVSFDRAYPRATTKLVRYRKIDNRASLCPVVVEGTPEQVQFAWEVGVGHSTGIGFGALI